jgi:hypothetical protein
MTFRPAGFTNSWNYIEVTASASTDDIICDFADMGIHYRPPAPSPARLSSSSKNLTLSQGWKRSRAQSKNGFAISIVPKKAIRRDIVSSIALKKMAPKITYKNYEHDFTVTKWTKELKKQGQKHRLHDMVLAMIKAVTEYDLEMSSAKNNSGACRVARNDPSHWEACAVI